MEKKLKAALIVVVVVLVILLAIVAFAYISLAKSETVKAQLHVEKGSVFLNGNQVAGDVKLDESDSIETGADGKATVILYESVLISLSENTKITVSDLTSKHPQIKQESGETWNQFTKFSGVEQYTITYGDSVASVRGTSFIIGKDKIIVEEGEVTYVLNGKEFIVKKGMVVESVNGQASVREATEEEKSKVEKGIQTTIENLRLLREKEIEKHPKAYNLVKEKFNLSDNDVQQALADADNGELDIKEAAAQSPVKLESVEKIIDITEKIKDLQLATKSV